MEISGELQKHLQGFSSPNVSLGTRSREMNILPSCASLFGALQSLSTKSLDGTVYRRQHCALEKRQGAREGELLVNSGLLS